MHINKDLQERIIIGLNSTDTLPQVAATLGIPEQCVVEGLPTGHCTRIGAEHFEEIMIMLATWGPIVLGLPTHSSMLEIHGSLPLGQKKEGCFVLEPSPASPMAASIQMDHLNALYFVHRLAEKETRLSIRLYNHAGACMLKICPSKEDHGHYRMEQVEHFLLLRDRLAEGSKKAAK